MRFLVLACVYVALTAYAVTDVLNGPKREYYGIHRTAWVWIIILAPFLGALIWLGLKWRGKGRERPRPKGPDDDPDYLRRMRDQERRRRES